MTSSNERRGVMLSTEPRPVMPKRRENVLGPTRYSIPRMPVRIHATVNPRSSREIPISIVDGSPPGWISETKAGEHRIAFLDGSIDGLRVRGWRGITPGKVIRFGAAEQNAEVSRPLFGGFEQAIL
jgi:hypothetical protein